MILLLLTCTCEEVLHVPTVQICVQNSTILTPNNLLIVFHSSITNWSQNTIFRNGGNFPISGCYTSTLTLNSWQAGGLCKVCVTVMFNAGWQIALAGIPMLMWWWCVWFDVVGIVRWYKQEKITKVIIAPTKLGSAHSHISCVIKKVEMTDILPVPVNLDAGDSPSAREVRRL